MADVVNRAHLLAFTLTMLSVAHFCVGFATNYATLVVCRVFVGFGEAFDPIAASLIADVFDEATKAKGMAIYNWGIYLGYGTAYLIKDPLLYKKSNTHTVPKIFYLFLYFFFA